MQPYARTGGALLMGAALVTLAACAGRTGGSSTLPSIDEGAFGRQGAPRAMPTPPITAPVTIPYPYTNQWTTKTWSGARSKPVSSQGSDTGVTAVKFDLEKSGTYNVLERIRSKSGYVEDLHSAIGFLPHAGGIAQTILSDDYSYVAGSFTETGGDTYPRGENSFDFPLKKGRTWSAAAAHTSYFDELQSGKGAFEENDAYTEAADGTYEGQLSFASLGRSKIQDNYASTTRVLLGRPSVYTLSERAAGYNKLTQTFEPPRRGYIDVRDEGRKPLPIPRGTVKVTDWYPDGALPATFYSDDFRVVGLATMPSDCGAQAGGSSTEVVERFANLDPVQGFYDTYTSWYYLAPLAKGQYWFACIVEKYRNDTYADAWAMSAGSWGKLSSEQIGTEILIASGAKDQVLPKGPTATARSPVSNPPGRLVR